jgi:GDP-mannose 6-dehydrogenase
MVRVSVFGLGYVGCVTGACLARNGHQVIGVDVNPDKVRLVSGGGSPVVEAGLGELIARVVKEGRLRATVSVEEAVDASDVALICVGTPCCRNGRLDVDALARVATDIGRALRHRVDPYTLVVRSTVLPGTTEDVVIPALLGGGALSFPSSLHVAVNPEFMREGSSIEDFARPPMTLVGCADASTASRMRELYSGVEAPFVHTSVRTAEMVKYAANAFHALKVCFANEIGDVCAALGADAQKVMRIFAMDHKLSISEAYLRPGFAFGGSCLPKDLRALLYGARSAGLVPPLLSAILPSNEAQVRRGLEAVLATRKRRVGVVGLAFKDGTDDLRESPMVTLVESLIGKGCHLRILDRNVSLAGLVGTNRRYIEEQIPHIASLMCGSVDALLAHAEVIVIGNAGPEASEVLSRAGGRPVVDLTRGTARKAARPGAAA